ncbi:endo alpha-1,4 polygalactosaminidase [Methylobacterium tarhaniae]|uniref:endo alpha-1,4 polygalactosaminidase n=1 Tax=Methylobacterium tarhaniae TaxID=1187852 RepID=UPI003D05AD14
MRRRAVLQMLACLGIGSAAGAERPRTASRIAQPDLTWAVYYGEDIALEAFAGFDVIVLDAGFKGDIRQIVGQGKDPLCYLSLGEIKRSSPLFGSIENPDILLHENPSWPDTFVCDVRQRSWSTLILERAIPAIVARGFKGLFFDTLDTPPHLEQLDPDRHAGMRLAAIDLVRAIRRAFPDLTLLMNRGYALLPEIKREVDGVVAESLLTTFDFSTKQYRWVEPDQLIYHMQALDALRSEPPTLPILSLDYWNGSDAATIREIYARERDLNHCPFVSEILLDRIVPEPPPCPCRQAGE